MATLKHWSSRLRLIVSLVLLSVGLVIFTPIQLGGQVAYVIISGNSMEPDFHLGDLAIVRASANYRVGDIVTYRHPTIGFVIHRIIAREFNHFVLKGDNNSWLDSYQPTSDEVVGKLWLHLPSVGKLLRQIRTPRNMALFTGFIGAFVMVSVQGTNGKRTRGTQRRARHDTPSSRHELALLGEAGQGLATLLGLVACLSLVLAVFAFTRPLERRVSEDITYQHSGSFEYSAEVPSGVYDTTAVTTGEPVFRQLATSIQVSFAYQLQPDQPADVHGRSSLNVVVSDINGWKRTLALAPETPFVGTTVKTSGAIDLQQIQSIIDRVEQETGLKREQYQLAVEPSIAIEGTTGGEVLHDTFAPRLIFHMDSFQVQLAADTAATTGDQLQPLQPSMLKHERIEPNTLSLFALELDISMARRIALFGLGGSLAGLLVLGLLMRRALGAGEAARIRARFGAQIITIADLEPGTGERLVQVAAFEDLAKLAVRYSRMILHNRQGTADHYYVQDDVLIYHYAVGEQSEPAGAAV